MPRLPSDSGSRSRMLRPALVSGDGLGDHLRAPGLHHHPPVGLLLVGDVDHVDLALEAEGLAGEGQRAAPLAGAGLGGQALAAGAGVVEGLRDGGVGLVRPGRRPALVLVVDARRGADLPLQPLGAVKRRRPPQRQHVQHLVGDRDLAVGRDLLQDQIHREQRRQVVGPDRLPGARVQRRLRRVGASARMLYQLRGISLSGRTIFVSATRRILSKRQRGAKDTATRGTNRIAPAQRRPNP